MLQEIQNCSPLKDKNKDGVNFEIYPVGQISEDEMSMGEFIMYENIKRLNGNYVTKIRKQAFGVRYQIGKEILSFYNGKYGENKMEEIAANTGISKSILYKSVRLAKYYSDGLVQWLMGFDYISYRLAVECTSIKDIENLDWIFSFSNNAVEAQEKIDIIKSKETGRDSSLDDGDLSSELDNEAAPNTDDADSEITECETSPHINDALAAYTPEEILTEESEPIEFQSTKIHAQSEEKNDLGDGQNTLNVESQANDHDSQMVNSQLTDGEQGAVTVGQPLSAETISDPLQPETPDKQVSSITEVKAAEHPGRAAEISETDKPKGQNSSDEIASEADGESVEAITPDNNELSVFQPIYNQEDAQGINAYIYEEIHKIGATLINTSTETPGDEYLRNVIQMAMDDLSTLLALVLETSVTHSGTTLSQETVSESSIESELAQV